MITRPEYLNSKDSEIFHKYYAQFVNDEIKSAVEDQFGLDTLVKAYQEDENLNSIKLIKWDRLAYFAGKYVDQNLLEKAEEIFSLATVVCILKNAARQLIEKYLNS